MIHFLAREPNTLEGFVKDWAPDLRPRIRLVPDYRLPFIRSLPPRAGIFSDFERLRPWRWRIVKKLAAEIRGEPDVRVLLNDPERYAGRFQLMRLLHERQINEFQARRVDQLGGDVRFPIFLRSEVDHRGAITGLLHSRDEVQQALSKLSLRNRLRKKHLIALEYCDCSDGQGLFRKYSAMKIGNALVPRHVLFSRNWVTKHADVVSDASVEEENEFLESFPHATQLAEVFRLAGIDYGRVDYGVKNGRVQVWEINTNPIVVPWPGGIDPRRLPSQKISAARITAALNAPG